MNSYDGSLDKRALDAYITGGHGQDDDPADEMEAWQQTASELSAERDDLADRLERVTAERDALLAACKQALRDQRLTSKTSDQLRAAIALSEADDE